MLRASDEQAKMKRKAMYQLDPASNGVHAAAGASTATDRGSQPTQLQTHSVTARLPAVISSPALERGVGGGSYRSIDQTFKMNPANGTMSLNLPIPIAEGRAGFGPNLGLAYNSGSGNGPFGLGWQLQVGSVTRKTSRQIPRYDESDVFLLSSEDELAPLDIKEHLHPAGFPVKVFRP